MNYTETMALAANGVFLQRVAFAIEKYAAYILNEDTGTTNHWVRRAWAVQSVGQGTMLAQQLAVRVLQDSSITDASTDAQLQSAVEALVNSKINQPPCYADLYTTATNASMLQRIQIAVAKFAIYILNEAPSTPNHNSRYNWAKQAVMNTMVTASQIANAVMLDSNVSTQLLGVQDAQLQAAVEAQIANLLL